VSQNENRVADHDVSMAENLLKLIRRRLAFVGRQQGLTVEEDGVERAEESGLATTKARSSDLRL
jgi:hypothetical protein